MMAGDEKVAFYLRHRALIEEWAALRGQAAAALEEAFSGAAGVVGQRADSPEIVKDDADHLHPLYRVSLQFPGYCIRRGVRRAGLDAWGAAEAIGRVMAVYGHQGPRRRQGGRRLRHGQESPAGGRGQASVNPVKRERLGLVDLSST